MKYSTFRSSALIIRDTLTNLVNSTRQLSKDRICYHVETADWSVEKDGKYITSIISSKFDRSAEISYSPFGVFGQILHFGSVYTADRLPDILFQLISKYNYVVVTFFHLESGDGRVDTLRNRLKAIDVVHTSCSTTRNALVERGIPDSKIEVVPIGVDTDAFRPMSRDSVAPLRDQLGIPESAIVIGSFQKDSHGWGDSIEPKLVKGPDILVEVARQLNQTGDVFFLLLGPARGYVKKKLDEYDVPYRHVYLEDYEDIPQYYNILDLYLVASRSEGGPKAIPESLATGTPLVTTRVGMAPDLISSGDNGYVVNVEDTEALVERAQELIESPSLRERFAENGLETAQSVSWRNVAEQFNDRVYIE